MSVIEVKRNPRALADILEEYSRIIKELDKIVTKNSRQAWEEASKEVGVDPEAVDVSYRPTLTLLSELYASDIVKIARMRGRDDELFRGLLLMSGVSNYDHGEINATENLLLVTRPQLLEEYRPIFKTSLSKVSNILALIKNAFLNALENCSHYYGSKKFKEFRACVADELETALPRIKREFEGTKWEGLKDELKELYKVVLKSGKEQGLGRTVFLR